MKTRFAPAPTGFLHTGHGLSALIVWELAREHQLEVILRIEDHDQKRCRPKYDDSIVSVLNALGFIPSKTYRQSEVTHRYQEALQQLASSGHLYACSCSRKDLEKRVGRAPHSGLVPYDGHCRFRKLDWTQPGTRVRLRVDSDWITFYDERLGPQKMSLTQTCGDFILRDPLGQFTYVFCNAVDDLADEISWIIRGEDILNSTPRQLYLRELLVPGVPQPRFYHHPLLLTGNGKLSKTRGHSCLTDQLAAGVSPDEILARLRSLKQDLG